MSGVDMRGPGRLRADTILQRLVEPAEDWLTTLDLRRIGFCEPIGLVAIACLVERQTAQGNAVMVHAPREASVANYLARMRLDRWLTALGAVHDLPSVTEHDTDDHVLELQSFDGARGAERAAEHLHGTIERTDPTAAGALFDAICETGANVAQHSGLRRGFAAAQRYVRSGRVEVAFSVGDAGVGMRASLSRYRTTTHAEAIRLGLQDGTSELQDVGRGNGLPDVVRLLAGLRGYVDLVSGDARVRARGGRTWATEHRRAFAGTLIQGTVRGLG